VTGKTFSGSKMTSIFSQKYTLSFRKTDWEAQCKEITYDASFSKCMLAWQYDGVVDVSIFILLKVVVVAYRAFDVFKLMQLDARECT